MCKMRLLVRILTLTLAFTLTQTLILALSDPKPDHNRKDYTIGTLHYN